MDKQTRSLAERWVLSNGLNAHMITWKFSILYSHLDVRCALACYQISLWVGMGIGIVRVVISFFCLGKSRVFFELLDEKMTKLIMLPYNCSLQLLKVSLNTFFRILVYFISGPYDYDSLQNIDFDDQGMENAMGHSIGCSAENRQRKADGNGPMHCESKVQSCRRSVQTWRDLSEILGKRLRWIGFVILGTLLRFVCQMWSQVYLPGFSWQTPIRWSSVWIGDGWNLQWHGNLAIDPSMSLGVCVCVQKPETFCLWGSSPKAR